MENEISGEGHTPSKYVLREDRHGGLRRGEDGDGRTLTVEAYAQTLFVLHGVASENGKQSTLRFLANDGLREALLRRWRGLAPMWLWGSQKPFSVQTTWNGEFQERWTVASGK
ncbi:MAG TPA: hypothetical protein PLN02_10095, partial [Azonexus sp.]|nr:hypothetical protein [Azonexus sp.]